MMQTVRIQDKKIGAGAPPYFIAELGICHQGSLDIAKELVLAAHQAGVDIIKTETFQRDIIVLDPNMTTEYKINGKVYSENLLEHMATYQLSYDEHAEIKKLSDSLGLPFMSTAHDFESVDFLADIHAAAIKISSADIIHFPLIRFAAKTGMVLFIDTSGAYPYEIVQAYKEAKDAGAKGVVFNHHPGGHPAPADAYDLRIIHQLKQMLNVPIGTADHYNGYEMVYAAAAIGADAIEKPVSLDRFIEKPEHPYSVGINDLPQVISGMHAIHNALGVSERENIKPSKNRVCIAASRNLEPGSDISLDTVIFGRPGHMGISVKHWDLVKGRKLINAKQKHEFITWDDV